MFAETTKIHMNIYLVKVLTVLECKLHVFTNLPLLMYNVEQLKNLVRAKPSDIQTLELTSDTLYYFRIIIIIRLVFNVAFKNTSN